MNCASPFGVLANGPHPTQSLSHPSAPVQTDAQYIGFREGGFLQVAVSEAPPPRSIQLRTLALTGAPDPVPRLLVPIRPEECFGDLIQLRSISGLPLYLLFSSQRLHRIDSRRLLATPQQRPAHRQTSSRRHPRGYSARWEDLPMCSPAHELPPVTTALRRLLRQSVPAGSPSVACESAPPSAPPARCGLRSLSAALQIAHQ